VFSYEVDPNLLPEVRNLAAEVDVDIFRSRSRDGLLGGIVSFLFSSYDDLKERIRK